MRGITVKNGGYNVVTNSDWRQADRAARIHSDHRAGRRVVDRLLPGIPGASGQGQSKGECLASLADAIALILEDGARK
jgi:hypothetical protein